MSPDRLKLYHICCGVLKCLRRQYQVYYCMRNCALLLLAQLHGIVFALYSFDFICIDKSMNLKKQ